MCAFGQKQTCRRELVMSALPPKADMCGANSDVRYGPIADMVKLQRPYLGSVDILLIWAAKQGAEHESVTI
jgi:hypothetical protein